MKWIKTHKLVTGLIVLVALIAIGAAAGGSSSKSNNSGDLTSTSSTDTTTPATTSTSVAAPVAPAKTSAPKAPAGIDHAEDIAIASCGNDDAGFAGASVVVTNHSSKSSNYLGTIAFVSSDGHTQLGTGIFAVDNLDSGQSSAPQDVSSLQDASGSYTCKLVDLTRYAA